MKDNRSRKERQHGKKKPRWMLGFHSKRKAKTRIGGIRATWGDE